MTHNPRVDNPRIRNAAIEIIAILNQHDIELIYLNDVFESVRTNIMLHTVPRHPKDYQPSKLTTVTYIHKKRT